MEFEDVLNNRRSIRLFQKKIVERDKLFKIINAATLAPSAGNLQSWHFVIIDDESIKSEIISAAMQQDWLQNAKILVVCAKTDNTVRFYGDRGLNLYCIQDTAAAIENILLEATNLGLGSCWVGAYDDKAVSRILKLPDNIKPVAIIAIGYSQGSQIMPNRYSIESVVSHDEYGKRIIDEGFDLAPLIKPETKKLNKGGMFDKLLRKWRRNPE